MKKLLAAGLIIGVALVLAAWGQVAGEVKLPQPGVEYMGSKQGDKKCPGSSARRGPFPCTYPVSVYPPSLSVPGMPKVEVYQSEVDLMFQRIYPGKDIEKKAIIKQSYQE
jgi:hypothetical protein